MNCELSEVKSLRERIGYLEEELYQLKRDLRPIKNPFVGFLGLSAQLSCILYMLYNSNGGVCSQAQLDRVTEANGKGWRGGDEGLVMNRTKVAICKLRKRLAKHGVEIQTLWGFGYQLLPVDRDRLTALIESREV
jgi:Transcriptional regulatory protein, C terminal